MTDMTEGKGTGGAVGVEFFVPSKEAVMKAIKAFEKPAKDYVTLPDNVADDTDLAKSFHDASYAHFTRFQNSAARHDLETYLKNADAKWRMAKDTENRYRTGSKQKQSTLSHVSSGQFYNTVRLITAGERSVVFNDPTSLPAKYGAKVNSDDYSDPEGKRVAEGQQLYAEYVWNNEDLQTWVKKVMLLTNKNSMSFLELQWKRDCETRPERVVGYYDAAGEPVEYLKQNGKPKAMFNADGEPLVALFDENGTPLSYVFVEKMRVTREWPVPIWHNAKDFYCDLELKDPFLRDQTCFVIRSQMTYGEALRKQQEGVFKNVENLTDAQLYKGETEQNSNLEEERYDNASQTKDDLANGLLDVFYVRMLAPISEDGKTPKWDKKELSHWWEGVYVGSYGTFDGNENTTGAVCLMLRKDPYHYINRFMVLHSHEDEKGLVRLGYYTILECLVEELTVLKDQLIDNKTLGVKSPMVAEHGNVLSRDLVFRDANQVLWVRNGTGKTALTKLEIPDMTAQFVNEYNLIKAEAEELAGITEALRGEFAGSRTTGTEYRGALEQAAKPAVEDAKQKYVPFFKWLFTGIAELGRQFGNPDKMLAVTNGKGMYIGDVNPTHLYGMLDVKVTSIDQFEADLISRQVMINFLQNGYAQAQPFMGQEGGLVFWRTFFNQLKMPNADAMIPENRRNLEAEWMAETDYKYILSRPVDALTNNQYLPKNGEQHDVQIRILQQYQKKWEMILPTLADEQKQNATAIIQALKLYIQLHEELKVEEGQMMGPTGQPAGGEPAGRVPMQAEQTPNMAGEATGDVLAGLAEQTTGGF